MIFSKFQHNIRFTDAEFVIFQVVEEHSVWKAPTFGIIGSHHPLPICQIIPDMQGLTDIQPGVHRDRPTCKLTLLECTSLRL